MQVTKAVSSLHFLQNREGETMKEYEPGIVVDSPEAMWGYG